MIGLESASGRPAEEEPKIETEITATALFQKVKAQEQKGMEPAALFSDYDGTLFAGDIATTRALISEAEKNNIPVIAVTGRGALALKDVIASKVDEYNEENPQSSIDNIDLDAIIGAVGTEIYYVQKTLNDTVYVKDLEYERMLIAAGFERKSIAEKVAQMVDDSGHSRPDIELDYQDDFRDVEQRFLAGDQSASVQPFKVSLEFYATSRQELEGTTEYFAERFPSQRIVICESIEYNSRLSGEDQKKKYCLDILPVTKAEAVDYLANKFGIKCGLTAGDSGNDSTMLIDTNNLDAVVVGGHKVELRASVDEALIHDPERVCRHFQHLQTPRGDNKRAFIPRDSDPLRGPDTIMHVAEVLRRAQKVAEFRRGNMDTKQ